MSDSCDSNFEKRARDVFLECLGFADASERRGVIESASDGDAQLEREVHALLNALEGSEPLFSQNLEFQSLEQAEELVGTRIDRYEVIEKLGEGGFGEVYRVLQIQPRLREQDSSLRKSIENLITELDERT